MNVAVVILNWNAAADTIRCVAQFDAWRKPPRLIVVDNASAPADVDQIARHCPHVDLIRCAQNLGFAGGTNRGIESALKDDPDTVLLLNNDVQLDEAAVDQLLRTLTEDPGLGMVGPLLYTPETPPRLISAGSRSPVWHLHNQIQTPPTDPVYAVDYISGSVALTRAAALRAVGTLDEAFFFSGEVADWCRRSRGHGYRTAVDSRACASHHLARSSAMRNTLYVYYIVRNRFLYVRNAYPIFNPTRWLLTSFWTIYSVLLAAKLRVDGNAPRARAVWMGVVDGLRRRFGGQNERVLAACAAAQARTVQP